MDIKVNNIEQALQPEAPKQIQDTGSDSFKFALMSNIAETELQEKLTNLMGEITAEGEIIAKRKNIKDMRRYRGLVKDFMNEILNRSHQFSRQNFLDKKGRHRVYGIIKLVDQNLDDLAAELLKEESDNIAILAKIGEIRGLLIDLLM
ncbi:MAG: YaaR family protein [Lachnospiraceae bacterium]|nr:YaaR family protein [Lachnospiraceae bacterium]MBR1524709.1 YaaR family protein [Lachnospiraceae bacterium]